jgi:hypothetical protein
VVEEEAVRTPHLSCKKGTTVRIVLRDGTEVVDKFLERKGKYVLLEGGKLQTNAIKTFGVRKHKCS